MSIGQKIRKFREITGLSQVELAKKLGVSQGSIGFWEKDQTVPRLPKIKKLAQIFCCTESDILELEPASFDLRKAVLDNLVASNLGLSDWCEFKSLPEQFAADFIEGKPVDKNSPNYARLFEIARSNIGADLDNPLIYGNDMPSVKIKLLNSNGEKFRDVPILGWAAAQDYNHLNAQISDYLADYAEGIASFPKAREDDFAVRIEGDSMSPWYPHGTIVLVRPSERPIRGKRVIAKLATGEIVFKVYDVDGDTIKLLSLNPGGVNFSFHKSDLWAYWCYPVKQSLRNEDDIDHTLAMRCGEPYRIEAERITK